MRQKQKKQAMDSIVQKIANNYAGEYLIHLREIASFINASNKAHDDSSSDGLEYRKLQERVEWLQGYDESELLGLLNELKNKLEQKILDKNSSYLCVLSDIAHQCVLSQILQNGGVVPENETSTVWDNYVLPIMSTKISECLDILKRYCPKAIEPEGYLEARKYIRIWDSEYYW